ncbi:LppU/SCO3897 family protein [Mycobacterium saskatchewanense]
MRTDITNTTTWTPANCDTARFATLTVEQRIDGSTDETQCPDGTKANAYPTSPRVYWLA